MGYTNRALPVDRRSLTHPYVTYAELGKPVPSLSWLTGKQTARQADGGAGKGM
ncbi:hypothetical protein [Sphingobacterium deserti]|uniref:hypothetical protein n=1 Tax=Sphingobacterium deserti TaxID=1229276 RepID=UPI0012FEF659|nr:hypothetical protein [Sphingobacterium deserti]